MQPDVQLLIDGQRYGGWQGITIERSIETAAGAFDLQVTERWAGQDVARPIQPGASCAVEVDGEALITGYVDDVVISHGAANHTVRVRGRDATADLVDCSAIHKSGAWSGATVLDIARDLARPFGVAVLAAVDIGGPFPDWQIQEGESVFECIERAARLRGLLVTTNGVGALLLTRAGAERLAVTLRLGENLQGASGTFSMRERMSEIRVKGTMPGSDLTTPEQHAEPQAVVTDAAVSRYRPLVIVGEDNGDPAVYERRATWERNVRFGRAARIEATVAGWRAGGVLWPPNVMVHYADPFMEVDESLLIAAVRLSLDSSGTLTTLSLTRREAFDIEPLPAKSSGGGGQLVAGGLSWAWGGP